MLGWVLFITTIIHFNSSKAYSEESWKANWIGSKSSSTPNSWYAFRKLIEIDSNTGQAIARIACDSKYWLWVNGELAVFEGQLKRGPTPQDTYYDQVDLSDYLKEGSNQIAMLVWYFGREGMSHHDSGQAGLVFDLKVGGQSFTSDKSWKVIRHPAYKQTKGEQPNWRLPESNITFDAGDPEAIKLMGWKSAGFDDSTWENSIEFGTPPVAPWNRLIERPIPQWKNSGLVEYTNHETFPKVSTGEPVVAKLPYNAQVTPWLSVEGSSGNRISIQTDNYLGGSEPNVRSEYQMREGIQDYESLGWMNGHEVIYTIPKGIKILGLKYRESGYDANLVGNFYCNNKQLDRLWKKSQRSLYVNMRDTYFDCPGRERAQWWGDVTLELQQAFYALDRRSDHLTSKAILELAAWQKERGELFSPIPAGNWEKELPMQMLAAVGRKGVWEYYLHSGDKKTIKQVYPAVKKYLSLWKLNQAGLVVERKGSWTWGDWGDNIDLPLLYNAWYYLALDGLRQMAELFEDENTKKECLLRQSLLKSAFNDNFWTAKGYRSSLHSGPIDDRGNSLAVVSGIANKEYYPTITKVLQNEKHSSPYMEKYVLEALYQMDEPALAITRMLERYEPMIDSPLSTLWEGWGIGTQGFGGGSYNHAWGGGPLSLLSQYEAGIYPLQAGYTHFKIAPSLETLTMVKARVKSARGFINVFFQKKNGRLLAKVSVPDYSIAYLELPFQTNSKIRWHQEQFARVPQRGQQIEGANIKEIHSNRIVIELKPGNYNMQIVR